VSSNRKIGPFLATILVTSTTVGSAIYLLPASLGVIGSISIVGWVLASIVASLIGAVFALLVMAKPGSGGLFSYIREAFGPGAGFVSGVLYWASCIVAVVAIALAVAGYLSVFIPVAARPPGLTVATIAIIWLFIGANVLGPRFIAQLQNLAVLLGLAPVLFAVIGGWLFFHGATFTASWNVSGQTDLAVLPRATVIAFWGFLGIETAIILAVRVKDPLRDVTVGTLCGVALSTLIYISASAVLMGILPAAALAKSAAPFADAFLPVLGASFAGAIALCAMLKASGTLAASLLLTVESAESEAVLGRVRAEKAVEPADRASIANLIFTGLVASLLVVLSASPTLARQYTVVTNASVVLSVVVYLASALALLRLSNVLPQKFRLLSYVVGALCSVFCIALIAASEIPSLIGSACIILLALVAHFVVQARANSRAGVATL
jgi:arginine:agmatine antiporter